MPSSDGPPRAVRLLLRLLVSSVLREEIEGDLTERHARIRERDGRRSADRWIWRQMRTLRPLALRRAAQRRRRTNGDHGKRGGGTMGGSGWGHDLRLSVRATRARPAAALTVVTTIALAVGATTAVFSVVNGVLLRPLPVPEPDRLVRVLQTRGDWMDSPNNQLRAFARNFPLSLPTFGDWAAADLGFEALGGYIGESFVHQTPAGAEVLRGQNVTSGLFRVLGVEPLLGRPLLPEDDPLGAPRVAVLSHGLWMERFAGDPGLLGRSLPLDGAPHTIVGVMPAGFQPPTGSASLWTPLTEDRKSRGRGSQFLSVVGRLGPGVTMEDAAARLAALQERLASTYPDSSGALGSRMVGLLDSIVGNVRASLWFLLGAVGLVLVIASVNIASLLSVIGLTRRRELAVKAALGAGAGRLLRSHLVESAVLASAGGLAGIVIAWASLPLLLRVVPPTVPRHDAIGMDGSVLLFGLAVTVLTVLLVGALPALQASAAEPSEMMRASGRGATGDRSGNRIRSALVITEVALAFVLLVGAGLLGTSYWRLWSMDRGFATEGLVAMSVEPDPATYSGRDERDLFLAELRERVRGIPGVQASATNQVPLSGSSSTATYAVERADADPEETSVMISVVLEDYFEVMSIPIVEGRGFSASDLRDAPHVGIVNRAMADAIWPGESPLGKRLRDGPDDSWVTVVGVAGDVRHSRLDEDVDPKLYVPAWQSERYPDQWVLRARGDVPAVVELARTAVSAVSPATPVREVEILEESIARSVAVPRFRTFFVVGLSAMAGVLALLGVFGIVTLSVMQRTREIGVRMALGASCGEVVRKVVGSGLRLAVGGLALGLLLAVPASRVVRDFLFEIEPTDPLVYAAIAAGVALVSAAASYLPARRAAAVDPVRVLDSE